MLYFSKLSSILLFLLIPAVSIKIYLPYSFSNSESIASLVVPAILLTITLFSPKILFTNEDFPTFGFPIIATFIVKLEVLHILHLIHLQYLLHLLQIQGMDLLALNYKIRKVLLVLFHKNQIYCKLKLLVS